MMLGKWEGVEVVRHTVSDAGKMGRYCCVQSNLMKKNFNHLQIACSSLDIQQQWNTNLW